MGRILWAAFVQRRLFYDYGTNLILNFRVVLLIHFQQRDNLSSIIYDESAGGIVVYGFANRSATSPQPYAAADVVIVYSPFE